MRKIILIFSILFLSHQVMALTFAESEYEKNQKSIYGLVGFSSGGFTFGADYEYNIHKTYSVGAYARVAAKDDLYQGGVSLGGFIRPHFFVRTWDFYVSAGAGIIMVDGKTKDETVLGPSLAFGMLYQIQPKFGIGIEQMNHYSWFGSTYKGKVLEALLANIHFAF